MKDILHDINFYHGAIRLEKTENGVKPLRFSEKLMDFFSDTEAKHIRAASPSGVSLQMKTDAEYIKLDFNIIGRARARANIGIIANGVGIPAIEIPAPENASHTAVVTLSGHLQTVEIYLPHLVELEITSISLSPGTTICEAVSKKGRAYLAYGDSITQGMEARDPCAIYPVLISRALGLELYNFGVGGAMFAPEQAESPVDNPAVITVMYGINDWMSSIGVKPSQFAANITDFLDDLTAQYQSTPCLVISPLWHRDGNDEKSLGVLDTAREIIRKACIGYRTVRYISGTSVIPSDQAYFADTAHPNDLGFAHMALRICKEINAVI